MTKFSFNQKIFVIITMLALLFAGISSFSKSYNTASAFGACPAVGSFTQANSISGNSAGIASVDAANRKWTVNEVFSRSVGYSSFYGEGPATWLYSAKEQRGKDKPGWTENTQKAIENARSGMCVLGGGDGVSYIFILIANGLTWLTGIIVMTLIGEDVMAETLTNIVGGGAKDGGLIETFVSSFYMPLVIIAVIIMATTLIYKGIIKRQLRESLSAILWTIGAFVVGLTLMLNPKVLASAPQQATSMITTCVLGSLSGQNCLSEEVKAPSVLSGKECISSVSGEGRSAQNVVNSLNCTIWKAFVLEPWAEEQFGVPYKKLYTKDPPKGEKVWKGIPKGEKGTKYCVNLSSKKSFSDSIESGVPVMDGSDGTICNVALYHLFVKTKMIDTVNQDGNNYNDKNVVVEDENGYSYDSRWYDLIVPMANDESKWRNYSGNGMFFSRLGTSIMSLIAIIASSTVLLTLAIFGGAYKVISLILMAFAPIFLLLAIEPTRGKRIFLGWLETLVSSILKYFAITVLIVVSLVMYAGLLSNSSGVASLVGTIVLTLALHMYRKELVNLIGASNMGGQKLSNKLNEVGSKVSKFSKDKGAALAGGGFGGAVGAGLARKDRLNARDSAIDDLRNKLASASTQAEKDFYASELAREEAAKDDEGSAVGAFIKGGASGTNDAFKRAVKRGTGPAARAFQQSDRTRDELRKKDEREQKEAKGRIADFEAQSDISKQLGAVEIEKSANEIKRDVLLNGIRDTQREETEYEGKLSGEEITALDNFADKLSKEATDEDLILASQNPAVLNDPNKRSLVANEINARIKANSMVGIASGELSRSSLADRKFLSNDELALNVQMHKENFLESGSQAELDKYIATQSEVSRRNGVEFNAEADKEALQNLKEKVGDDYKRSVHIPTEEQLKKLDEYKVKLPNGEFNSTAVAVPNSLSEEVQKHKDKIAEVKKVDEDIKLDNSKKSKKDDSNDNNSNNNDSTTGSTGSQETKGPKILQKQSPLPVLEELDKKSYEQESVVEQRNRTSAEELVNRDPFSQGNQTNEQSQPQQKTQPSSRELPKQPQQRETIDIKSYERNPSLDEIDKGSYSESTRSAKDPSGETQKELDNLDFIKQALEELEDDSIENIRDRDADKGRRGK